MKKILLLLITLLTPLFCIAKSDNPKPLAPLFDNLGSFHHKITTKSKLAQSYFDQGLVLLYSFEFGEAIRSFRGAVRSDPHCAMCYWGLALALGSKTDAPLDGHELEQAKKALQSAAKYVDPLNRSESAYIAALRHRYMSLKPQALTPVAGLCSSYSLVSGQNAKDYANEMQKLGRLFPSDPEAKTLYAAALFDVTEWDFWDHQNNQAKPYTLEIIKTLEAVLSKDKDHPGANHLYVHIIEFSPFPQRALPSANRLHRLVPASEHMAHMPCHTYFSLGQYHKAAAVNQQAISIYKNYVKSCKAQGFQPEVQYLYYHNYDYLTAAASMEGRKNLAIESAKELAIQSAPLIKKNGFLQKWLTPSMLILARFGEWDKIPQLPKPDPVNQYALGIWYYVQALAEIQYHQIQAANNHLSQLQAIIKRGPSDKNLGAMGIGLLQISNNILEGLLAKQAGQNQVMIEKFKAAIKIQDEISNRDPPSWYVPVRQLLGDALLNMHQYSEAKTVFLQDLKEHPHNGWSLFGLAQCLHHLGENQKAKQVEGAFKKAWANADIPEPISFFDSRPH